MPQALEHHAQVQAIRLTLWRQDLETDARKVVGYRAACDCGWKGPRRATYALARFDLLDHLEATHER